MGLRGFRGDAARGDDTVQPDSRIMIVDACGGNKRPFTDSQEEDSMPLLVPSRDL